MNKSLELNFWRTPYDSVVFLYLQTPEVYLKLNIELVKSYLFYKISFFTHLFIVIIVIFEIFISQDSIAMQLKYGGIFSNNFITNFPQNVPMKKSVFRCRGPRITDDIMHD